MSLKSYFRYNTPPLEQNQAHPSTADPQFEHSHLEGSHEQAHPGPIEMLESVFSPLPCYYPLMPDKTEVCSKLIKFLWFSK